MILIFPCQDLPRNLLIIILDSVIQTTTKTVGDMSLSHTSTIFVFYSVFMFQTHLKCFFFSRASISTNLCSYGWCWPNLQFSSSSPLNTSTSAHRIDKNIWVDNEKKYFVTTSSLQDNLIKAIQPKRLIFNLQYFSLLVSSHSWVFCPVEC